MYQYEYSTNHKQFSRALRRGQTDAEKKLWAHLRGRRFLGLKFQRQYPVDTYILDFYCVEKKLAIELDGGQHAEDDEVVRDTRRTEILSARGISIVRFWNNDVLQNIDGVLEELKNIIGPHPALS